MYGGCLLCPLYPLLVNIKNVLEYNPSYAGSVATNEFYFLVASRNAEERKFTFGNVRNAAGDGQTAVLLTVVANYIKFLPQEKHYWEHQPQ